MKTLRRILFMPIALIFLFLIELPMLVLMGAWLATGDNAGDPLGETIKLYRETERLSKLEKE